VDKSAKFETKSFEHIVLILNDFIIANSVNIALAVIMVFFTYIYA